MERHDVVANAHVLAVSHPRGGQRLDLGTEVRVVMEYAPLGGAAGSLVARLFGTAPEQQVDEDLRRLKQILETGDPITVEGQPSGRAKPEDHPTPSYVRAEEAPKAVVQQASEESFPASDPPAYY